LSQLSGSGDYQVMASPKEMRTDSELVRASVGDPSAFEILFVRHAAAIRAWLASDRSQEILARLAAAGLGVHLTAALKGLPEGQRRALDARIVRELDYPSVAAELQCTEPNARALVSRGLRRLNATLDGAEP
jgi:Sigma-70, region 4